ncbi:MAG: CBS domain-containing protein [Thiobacillus sp.]
MASFQIYALNAHELMPLNKVFKRPGVEKTAAIVAEHPIGDMDHPDASEQHDRQTPAEQAYRAIEQLTERPLALLAEQVMTSPVVILTPEASITEALRQFQKNAFRHIPVVTSAGRLVGIVSDRDILRYLAGLSESYQQQIPHTRDARVEQLMTPQVLTASADTDIRHIARLFVEQHIGAMPIVKNGKLEGIITRSDVLGTVMRHYALELWA